MFGLLNWFREKKLDKIIEDLAPRDEYCQRLISRIDADYRIKLRPLNYQNISSYFLIDMLERAFANMNIADLPSNINVLDVGVGTWYYAPALLNFLKYYKGQRKVCLEGVDFPKRDHKKSINNIKKYSDVIIHWDDVMNLNQKEKYDIIFMIHMLGGPSHFKAFKVPYCPSSQMFPHVQSLGKPNGLFVLIAHNYAGEEAILNCLKKEAQQGDMNYRLQTGDDLSSEIGGRFGFHDNWISICRLPFVDLEACKERDRELKMFSFLEI